MNVSVASAPVPMRNSLILTGLTLRTRSAIEADCVAPWLVHEAMPTMSPLKLTVPEVTRNVALTLSPGATGPGIVSAPWATELHCAGRERPSLTFVAGAPLVLVNVTTVSWLEPGANVCRPGGPAGVKEGVTTVPAWAAPDESATFVPLASSNR